MGNENGLSSAITNFGTNTVINIDEEIYFSFAFGNEIAFCIDSEYYILNCDEKLFDECKKKVEETKDIKEIKLWWIKKSKTHEINDYSKDFSGLE